LVGPPRSASGLKMRSQDYFLPSLDLIASVFRMVRTNLRDSVDGENPLQQSMIVVPSCKAS